MTEPTYDFFTLGLPEDATAAVIDKFSGIDGAWRISDGERMGDRFPSTVSARLDSDWGDRLTDFLGNTRGMIVVSRAARSLLEESVVGAGDVEYLPFVLENRKGREISGQEYCVAHPLRQVHCMNRDTSVFSALDDGEVSTVSSLEILQDRVPEDAILFRLGEFPRLLILRSDLVERIRSGGLTGLCLTEMGDQIW